MLIVIKAFEKEKQRLGNRSQDLKESNISVTGKRKEVRTKYLLI